MAGKNIWQEVLEGIENITSLFSDATFKVTPEILAQKSSDVAQKAYELRRHFGDLNSLLRKTKEYWIGDAGDMHREKYESLTEKIEECLNRLDEHPRDLVAIAQKYTDVELRIEVEVEGLAGDILE